MMSLNAANRNTSLKPNQLRRNGIIPGVLYGKGLEESLSIQFSQAEVIQFLKSNATGSRAELVIGDKKYPTLLREATFKPATDKLLHVSFQMLVAGEVVTSAARIVLVNRDKVTGLIHQQHPEVSYRALPSHLIETIEIDLEGAKVGDSMRVSDLDIGNNPDIEILSPLDTVLYSIADLPKPADLPETEDAAEPETQSEESE